MEVTVLQSRAARLSESRAVHVAILALPFVVVIIAFIRTRNQFAASVGLWWFGESLIDLGPYINDARAGQHRRYFHGPGQLSR